MKICLGLVVVFALVCAQARLSADVQTGNWKVSSNQANHGIFVNYSGATQKVLATWCMTAGGTVSVQVNNADVAILDPGNCSSRSMSLSNTQSITMHLSSGTSANGTYSVTVLP